MVVMSCRHLPCSPDDLVGMLSTQHLTSVQVVEKAAESVHRGMKVFCSGAWVTTSSGYHGRPASIACCLLLVCGLSPQVGYRQGPSVTFAMTARQCTRALVVQAVLVPG